MAQQINLLAPILLAPRRYLSALTLLQASGLLLLASLGAALWILHRDHQAEAAHQATLARFNTERQALQVARANLPAPQDALTLQQQLQPLETGNAERRALLQTLGGSNNASREGQHHSDLLALLARSLPESAWITELRHSPGRVELIGGTLDTAVLRPWLARLSMHPMLAGQELSALRVERLGAAGAEAAGPALLERNGPLAQSSLPVWAFRVVSAPATPAAAGSGTPGAAR
ncbi:MAG: hypothetical protein EOP35_11780 [Rubrivivax sp.]|nr:MAG: hypothetical protein EOP35_11780 [Rubrivivax sp.]